MKKNLRVVVLGSNNIVKCDYFMDKEDRREANRLRSERERAIEAGESVITVPKSSTLYREDREFPLVYK